MQNLAARHHSWRFYVQAVGEEIAWTLQEPLADRSKRAEQRLKSVDWNKLAGHYKQRSFNPVSWVLGADPHSPAAGARTLQRSAA
jgi:LuxR family maltose regulon positive regulatory protein